MTFHRRIPIEGETVPCRNCGQSLVITRSVGHTNRYACDGCIRARHREDWLTGKDVARSKLRKAVRRGDIVPLPCERCGASDVEGHHHDYTQPFDVRWLCRDCHSREHAGVAKRVRVRYAPLPAPSLSTRRAQLHAARATRWARVRTHCSNGHEYTASNTNIRTYGDKTWRECRTCSAAAKRRHEQRRRQSETAA